MSINEAVCVYFLANNQKLWYYIISSTFFLFSAWFRVYHSKLRVYGSLDRASDTCDPNPLDNRLTTHLPNSSGVPERRLTVVISSRTVTKVDPSLIIYYSGYPVATNCSFTSL